MGGRERVKGWGPPHSLSLSLPPHFSPSLPGAYLIKAVMPSTDFRGADLSDSLADRAVFVDANFEDAVLVSVEREREGEIFNPGARARARAGRLARFTHRHTHTHTHPAPSLFTFSNVSFSPGQTWAAPTW